MHHLIAKTVIQFAGQQHDIRTAGISEDGLVLAITYRVLAAIRNLHDGVEEGVRCIVRFPKNKQHDYMLAGRAYDVEIDRAYWVGEDVFQLSVRFVDLSPLQQYHLGLCVTEVIEAFPEKASA